MDGQRLDSWIKEKIGLRGGDLALQAVKDYQLQRLQETIAYVSGHSPFYRRHFQEYPGKKLRGLADLKGVPFTTPQDLRNHGLQMLCVSQSEIERVVTLESSGTTGVPKRVYFTRDDRELTIDFFVQGMALLTSPGDRVLILLPGERPGSIGDLLYTALLRLGTVPIKYGFAGGLPETLEKITATRADVLVGIPIQVLALARYSELKGRQAQVFLKRLLLSTDYVSRAVVRELQRIWGCEVFRYYGLSEMGLGGGIECSYHNGFHLYEADFLVEIVHPVTGEIQPEGQWGEVVFTTLTRRGMPLIRYRTGDLSRYLPGGCSCGSSLPRLENITARKTGVIRLAAECFITMADLDEILLAIPGVIDFTAIVSYLPDYTSVEIQIKTLEQKIDTLSVGAELSRNNAFGAARERGKLELIVKTVNCNDNYVPPKGKRMIITNTSLLSE
ncbi:MAG: DVU_1553 family AMP-dependent CoA ligase [Peptococcaceae bacterium]